MSQQCVYCFSNLSGGEETLCYQCCYERTPSIVKCYSCEKIYKRENGSHCDKCFNPICTDCELELQLVNDFGKMSLVDGDIIEYSCICMKCR